MNLLSPFCPTVFVPMYCYALFFGAFVSWIFAMKSQVLFSTQAVLATFLNISTSVGQKNQNCPLLGPSFPAPSDIGSTQAIRKAQEAFPQIVQNAMSAGLIDNETTSFSISVFSASDNKTLYEQHFNAPGLNGSLTAGKLDDRTVYRVGSISKLFTVYAILIKNGMHDFNQPITNYVPELANQRYSGEVESIRWEDVTVAALASHLAGIARDCKEAISPLEGEFD
jgi:CubicO group peptidase (beta-lactamase class C family)